MFIVLLRFGENKADASHLMKGHAEWIAAGINDGAFLLVGSLRPNLGGAVMALAASREVLEARLARDPWVAARVVEPEILEVVPARTDPRLAFLLAPPG